MSNAPGDKRRTWLPLAAAGGIAVLVIAGAVVWTALFGGPSEIERDAIAACEAAYAEQDGPAIEGGEVYEANEFREYYAVAETHGDVPIPLEDVPDEQLEAWDEAAEIYEMSGTGPVAVVWRLADDSYLECSMLVVDGAVDDSQVELRELGARGESE